MRTIIETLTFLDIYKKQYTLFESNFMLCVGTRGLYNNISWCLPARGREGQSRPVEEGTACWKVSY